MAGNVQLFFVQIICIVDDMCFFQFYMIDIQWYLQTDKQTLRSGFIFAIFGIIALASANTGDDERIFSR